MKGQSEMIVRLERLIPIQPDLLFAMWIDPAQLVRWWAPEGYEPSVRSLDSNPGGRWRITMRGADGAEVATSGVFRVVDPPHRLSFTWAWEDATGRRGHETQVTVRFEPAPGGTRLVLIHEQFERPENRDNHHRGWSGSFDRMSAIAALCTNRGHA
jgi:uncharacterized protein YndB with AHSA1/START domain